MDRKAKFIVGEKAEVLCDYLNNGQRVHGWLTGTVVQVDRRMAAVAFDNDVFSSNGYKIPDRTLWCAHGSQNIRHVSLDEA